MKRLHTCNTSKWSTLFRVAIETFFFGLGCRLLTTKTSHWTTTSDRTMSVVGKPIKTLAPFVSRSHLFQGQSRTLLSIHILQISDEKQIESVAISVIARPADYLRRVTAELLHPDRVSHRQCSVHTRRQGHVCSFDRLITTPCA